MRSDVHRDDSRTTWTAATRTSSWCSWPPPCYRGSRVVVLAAVLLIAQVLPPANAISWLMLRHAPLDGWRSSSCRGRWGLTPRQVALCRSALDAMPHVARAAQLTVSTCRQLFADRRWNCSSLDAAPTLGPDLYTGTREQAYVYALSSAAVTYSLARACAQGALPHCSCAGPPRDPPNGNFKWGGCGDNVRYGAALARQFADAAERRGKAHHHPAGAHGHAHRQGRTWSTPLPPSEPAVMSAKRRKSVGQEEDLDHLDRGASGGRRRRLGRARTHVAHVALANLHNNRAGRRAVESSEVTQCKCHGVSGSCNIKTCWRALPRLADIGLRLQRRFASAVEVASRRTAGVGRRLVPAPRAPSPAASAGIGGLVHGGLAPRHYTQDDLIFLAKSPDYCLADPRTGSSGTHGRSCNASSTGFDSCQDMCCGRGYRTVTIEKVERCQCKYYWCCYVKCKTCSTWIDVHECL